MENRHFIRRSPNDLVEVGMIVGPASTGEDPMEKLTMFLMVFRSALERGGSPVRREEMTNWGLPPPTRKLIRDGQPSDAAFSDPYSKEELASISEQG